MNEAIKMQISAFVDGELPDSEADLLLRRLSQDAALRREAADYLEFGRIMRGEFSVRGVEQLRERIAAAIDDKIVEEDQVGPESESGRAVRPLLGVAVAASVALVAIFGLQLTPGTDTPSPAANAVASVPGRISACWGPPCHNGDNATSGASNKAPTPRGPPNLWLDSAKLLISRA